MSASTHARRNRPRGMIEQAEPPQNVSILFRIGRQMSSTPALGAVGGTFQPRKRVTDMLRMFFDTASRIGWEACAMVGVTLAIILFVGFTAEMIIQARKHANRT